MRKLPNKRRVIRGKGARRKAQGKRRGKSRVRRPARSCTALTPRPRPLQRLRWRAFRSGRATQERCLLLASSWQPGWASIIAKSTAEFASFSRSTEPLESATILSGPLLNSCPSGEVVGGREKLSTYRRDDLQCCDRPCQLLSPLSRTSWREGSWWKFGPGPPRRSHWLISCWCKTLSICDKTGRKIRTELLSHWSTSWGYTIGHLTRLARKASNGVPDTSAGN